MFTIEKEFHFCASHYLRDDDSACSRMHGHNYIVVLVLRSEYLDDIGFVRPFRDLDRFKQILDEKFDHRTLNDIPPFDETNPTTEMLACVLFHVARKMFPELVKLRVSETPKTWVEYEESS